jgi:DNA-binding HxlR family transcriptional regulator
MQPYNQYCPVARASEILGDRWTILILREMILGSRRFNEIERGLPGISRSLLASRLRDLQRYGVIERGPGAVHATEYHLTDAGRDLKSVIEALGAWGVNWAFDDPSPEEMDAGLVVWKVHQRIDRDRLPDRRTVVEFDFTGPRPQRAWLVLEPSNVSVCVTPPRFESDLIVRTSLPYFLQLWFGRVDFDTALRCGGIVLEGPQTLRKQFSKWLLWSPMSRFVRDRERRRQTVAVARTGDPRSIRNDA